MSTFKAIAHNTGELFKTKKAFREAMDNDNVILYNLGVDDIFNPGKVLTGIDEILDYIDSGNSVTIVGPDPATNRKWYATVDSNYRGNFIVK